MKKLRYALCTVLVLAFSVFFIAGCDFFNVSDYKQFEIEYTKNMEFLVGENYHDPLLKGYATKKDDTIEDVTSKMTIDSSAYNKNAVGQYTIDVTFEGTKLSYSVNVVEEIANETEINVRLQKAIDNTFVRDNNGKFSYKAENSQTSNNVTFAETLIYKDVNGVIDIYLKYEYSSELYLESNAEMEFWYTGNSESGNLYMNDEEGVTCEEVTIEDLTYIIAICQGSIYPIHIDDISADVSECVLTLDQDGYHIIGSDFEIDYKNNLIYSVNGVSYDFQTTEVAPALPVV